MQARLAVFSSIMITTLGLNLSYAQLDVTISKSVTSGIPIAIAPFEGTGTVDVANIVINDLARSGKFQVLPPNSLPQRISSLSQFQANAWQSVAANYLTVGKITGNEVLFQLGDMTGGQIDGRRIAATPSSMSRAAHQISDIIFEKLTGLPGAFDSKLAYVATNRREYALIVADVDGANPQTVFSSKEPILSPQWSPNGRYLAYGSLEGKKSRIILQDTTTGSRNVVSESSGINSAPSFSPDGSRLVFSLSKDGNPEIYTAYTNGTGLQRLTNHPGIDTEPTWSRDGYIYFTSDRGGSPQIYKMSANGGAATRITFDGGNNANPAISSDAQKLAYVQSGSGIIVMDLQTGAKTALQTGGRDEAPSFSPNGLMIIYGNGRGGLETISIDGNARQTFSGAIDIRDPAWSPKLN